MAETKKTTKTATKAAAPKKTAAPKAAPKATAAKPAAKKVATPKAEAPKKVAPKAENKQPEKVAEVKVAKKATKQIKVTYTKSVIGYDKRQAKVLQSLGLKKMHSFAVLPDNASTRGMIHKVAHLVTVEEVK